MAAKLGQLLITAQLITEEQLRDAVSLQRKEGGRLGANLVRLGYLSEEGLVGFLSRQWGVPAINLSDYKIDPSVLKLVPADVARKYFIIPVARVGATLTIAMADPSNVFVIDDVKFMTGYKVEVVVSGESSILHAISAHYRNGGSAPAETKNATSKVLVAKDYTLSDGEFAGNDMLASHDDGMTIDVDAFNKVVGEALGDIEVVDERDEETAQEVERPIVKLVNGILINAIKERSSDIHIEPYENSLRVRQRVDGVMYTVMNLPVKIKSAVTSRIKIMANLDIAERRLPQDGRIKLKLGKKREVDFRVSTVPCLFGERTVLRLLDKSSLQVDLTKLGFEEETLQDFMRALDKPYGMILVTGPTGSGKTTTLYSALNYLNKIGVNISTAEDPVEYNFHGINQVHVKEEIGLTFASALRSFLRQDPDIIMVGEIRDFETAEIAVKAALTGHLVLSTLHTNDAPSTISRLLNMGIEPFLVAASLILIATQRLIRVLCPSCKQEDRISVPGLMEIGFSRQEAEGLTCYKGRGCPECNNSGYKGRLALYEVMPLNDELRSMILEGASADELKKTAVRSGMRTLRVSGLAKIKKGITSVDEVLRVTFGD